MFCKTCGTILLPKKTKYGQWMACPRGHPQPKLNQETNLTTEKNVRQTSEIGVNDGVNILAVHDHKCPRCQHDKAELLERGPAYSDEDGIYQMRCGKCNFIVQLEGKVK